MTTPDTNTIDQTESRLDQLYSEIMSDCVTFLSNHALLEVVSGISLSVKFRPEYHEALGEEESATIFTPNPQNNRLYYAQTED